jgi:3-O-alpha-D-mannopyranosyl-alpha-D-mannopyranose xylosylphosphotransferase
MYSMRSVLANMPGHLRTIHLITADYQFDSRTDIDLIPPQPEVWEELEELAEREFAPDGRWTKSGKATARPEREGLEARAGGPVEGLIHANAQYRPEKISNKLSGWFDSAWRVAQVPTWLEFSRVDLADPHHPLHHLYSNPFLPKKPLASHLHALTHPSLRYAVHTEIFHLPSHKKSSSAQQMLGLGASEWKEDTWRENALPTFNSMAIESRIGWLWGLADVSLSFNDDFFMLKPHAVADWFSGLYGTVLRLDYNYMQQVRPILDKKLINDAGESGGLYHANWLLSQRFPRRLRPYFAHVPKVITRGLHHEASLMFEEALTTSSQRKFRELPIGEGDVQMQWLLTALRIERWREALLWTWVVGKVGTRPIWEGKGNYLGGEVGMWGEEAREEISNLFGLGDTDDDVVKIEVHRGERWTMERDRMTSNFENAGWEPPKNTEMLWCRFLTSVPLVIKIALSSVTI